MEKADLERDNCFRRLRRKLEVACYENTDSVAYKVADVIRCIFKHQIGHIRS